MLASFRVIGINSLLISVNDDIICTVCVMFALSVWASIEMEGILDSHHKNLLNLKYNICQPIKYLHGESISKGDVKITYNRDFLCMNSKKTFMVNPYVNKK